MNSDAGPTIEVLVAGAGPVGLALAAELARHGVALRIVDKAVARTDKSKALVVWSRTLELMEIMGCAERFVATGRKITRANIYASARRLARLRLDRVDSAYPFALFLPQSETERLIEEHLARLGVAVERGVELVAFERAADGVVATLARADGTRETVRARWLAGCDGAHSFVRHTLAVPFAGETETADFFLADLHLDGNVSSGELSLFWHPEGILGIFPMTPGRFRVIADVMIADMAGAARGSKPADPTLAEVQAVLDRRGPGGLVARDPAWLSGFRINERKAVRYRDGSVFLLGDAAHIHSPAGGQGMNTGIQDAVNLAWKLALVARGRARPALLESYGAERSAVGERVLKNATRLTRLAILRGPIRQALRNAVLTILARIPAFQRRFAETMTELDISYRGGPMSVGPEGGARIPDREVRRLDGTVLPLYRLLREDRLVLLASAHGGDVGDLRRAALMAIEALYPSTVVAAIADGVRSLSVVRPDAYLGFADRGGDLAAAQSYLASFLNRG
jgi:2-polyprenyl-6-methoxyphenol hydroxylase-like FAD-dependent oxidoreductase